MTRPMTYGSRWPSSEDGVDPGRGLAADQDRHAGAGRGRGDDAGAQEA